MTFFVTGPGQIIPQGLSQEKNRRQELKAEEVGGRPESLSLPLSIPRYTSHAFLRAACTTDNVAWLMRPASWIPFPGCNPAAVVTCRSLPSWLMKEMGAGRPDILSLSVEQHEICKMLVALR